MAFKCPFQQLQTTLKEENDRKIRSTDYNLQKYKVYCFDQRTQQMANIRLFLPSDATLEEALESAHKRLKLQHIAMERCRLVAYDSNEENVQCSFEGKDMEQIRELLCEYSSSELLLEIRDENTKFDVYHPGDIETRVYVVDTCSADIDGPFCVRVHKNTSVRKYKELVAQHLRLPIDDILMATFKFSPAVLEQDNAMLSDEDVSRFYIYIDANFNNQKPQNSNLFQIIHKSKVFVTSKTRSTDVSKFMKLVSRSNNLISLYFTLPKTDKGTTY